MTRTYFTIITVHTLIQKDKTRLQNIFGLQAS